MNRIDRLQAIIIQLQSKKIVKAHEIASRFNISLRTVYRDVRALEDGGVPIGAEAGIGYFLDESYSLPPVMFTTNEAIALLIAGKLIPHMSDRKIDQSFQEALYKIKSVLKADDKKSLEKLEQSVRVYSGIKEPPQKDTLFLQEVQKALIHSKVMQLLYYSQYSQQESQREVEPIALIFYAMNWHLIAWCKLRKAYRDFRLDRIRKLILIDKTYERKLDKAFEEYLKCQKEQNEYLEFKLKVTQPLAQFINESKYWYGFVSEEQREDKIEMTFMNPDLHGFARWVITMGVDVDIVEPIELYEILRQMILKIYPKYVQK
jgi:predicted DNA-binding transcriptional regulator YafY